MIRSNKRLVFLGLLATGMMIATGCGKGSRKPPPVDENALAGNWIEYTGKITSSPRARTTDTKKKKSIRYLTVNADKTFEFSLKDNSGKPAKKGKKVEGTWEINLEEQEIIFTVTNNAFKAGEEGHDWAPMSSYGPKEKDVSGQGMMMMLSVADISGSSTMYKRAD